ncbi:NmrA family NAD(P)-binding protein [Sphingomonas sp. OK281]|uniref:NmrA family NAD(P)-binding protein n=1 Tax=Sphingomonas sp. OK281 TaxID=1881067 RepID=UPI0008E1C1C9|nr:NmrA family NAD(P)-binding protein [Sphingomonas sp. OK281]SFO43317.1 Uncharacterized conserved protein YbjT, contains NAD(P)-binding and DUF2867 domains [Sphingomonas sp. OK281]
MFSQRRFSVPLKSLKSLHKGKLDEQAEQAPLRKSRNGTLSGATLVVGAAGKFAGLVLPELHARGVAIRALIHNPADSDAVKARGASEIIAGDLADRATVQRALAGVKRVFYIAPAFLTNEVEIGRQFVAACTAADVKRLVFSSLIHPVLENLPNHAAKPPVEAAVLDSGLEYTLLHPSLFFQNYLDGWSRIVATETVAEPWSSDTRFSRVDYRDVAEVAAIALTEERLLYGTFELCAEGRLDRHDVAALIGKVLGRPIKAARVDPDTLGERAAAMRPMFDHYDHHGLLGNALTLRAILGREPRTLEAFFEELATDHWHR